MRKINIVDDQIKREPRKSSLDLDVLDWLKVWDAGEVYFHDFGTGSGVVTETSFIYHDGNIHNYIITKKGSTLKVYIDSIEKVSITRTASLPDQDYHIGYSLPIDAGHYLTGTVKRLDIWKGTGI